MSPVRGPRRKNYFNLKMIGFGLSSLGLPQALSGAFELVAGGLAVPGGGADAAFAELVFLHLAVLGRGQCGDEFDIARHGEIRQQRLAIFYEVERGEALPRVQNDRD